MQTEKQYKYVYGIGRSALNISETEIRYAMENTKSNAAAARFLKVSFTTYKKYATLWGLYDDHKNQSGRGIHKVFRNHNQSLDEILSNKYKNYSLRDLKKRLIDEGYMDEECSVCGYNEKRITDDKICLWLDQTDTNDDNYSFENLRLLCPNCYFTNVGNFKNSKSFCK